MWQRRPFSAPRVCPGQGSEDHRYDPVPPVLTDDEGYEWPARTIDTKDPEYLETKAAFERLIDSTGGLR